jgi:hypothetical protein
MGVVGVLQSGLTPQSRPRSVRRWLWLGAFAFVVVGGALGYVFGRQTSQAAGGRPKTESVHVGFEPGHIDLGKRLWGQEVPFQLTLVNGGASPLTVQRLDSSCGCAVVERERYEGMTVGLNGSLTIDAVMHTEATTGKRRAAITLTADDGAAFACSVTLEVVGTWKLSDTEILIDNIVLGEADPEAFSRTIMFASDQDELLEVKPMCDWLEVRVAKRESGAAEILLRGLKDRMSPGFNIANAIVSTNNAIKPEGAIYVKAWARPALEPTRPQVSLLGTVPQRVSFRAHDGAPVQLTGAESANDAVVARIVDDNTIEVTNAGGETLPQIVTVKVTDRAGRITTVQVSTFANAGEKP